MAKYKSRHTGLRIDNAVDKIPNDAPKDESVIVVQTTGTSGYKKISELSPSVKWGDIQGTISNQSDLNNKFIEMDANLTKKQDTLISGTTIKTINNESILGPGNIDLTTDLNIENGTGASALNQVQDGTSGTFDFTDKNPNATALDNTLTGQIEYGGVGAFATSFGGKSQASGKRSFAAGTTTIAKGNYSAAFGDNSVALGGSSHAEGEVTVAAGVGSHSEGKSTVAKGLNAHSEGYLTTATGDYAHTEGYNTNANARGSHAEGDSTMASGQWSHTEGDRSTAKSYGSHAEGGNTTTCDEVPSSGGGSGGDTPEPEPSDIDTKIGWYAHSEGDTTKAVGYAAHAEGCQTIAFSHHSHAEGLQTATGSTISDAKASHAEGVLTKALGFASHAEGYSTTASGQASHAEGNGSIASGENSFAIGGKTKAEGVNSFAAGLRTTVKAHQGAAFGSYCSVEAIDGFAAGENCSVYFQGGISLGQGTATGVDHQVVVGRYNQGRSYTVFEVGNGTASTKRSNALEVLTNGRVKVQSAPVENDDVVRKIELDAQKVTINSGASATGAANTITVGATTYSLPSGGSNIANLSDGSGTKAVNQILNNSTTNIDVVTKNPNAYNLDNSLANTPIGASGESSATFGGNSAALSKRSLAIGTSTVAKGKYSLAAGDNSITLGNDSAAFGYSTVAQGLASFASGNATIAAGENAHTEGFGTKANGYATHAEGNLTIADGNNSHAEGISTQAKGYASHAEGNLNIASGEHAHAEGYKNTASGSNAHAEGSETKAVGLNSHTEGWLSEANGDFSHVEGYKSTVKTTQYSKPSGGGSGSGAGGDAGDTDPSWTASEHRGEGSHASGILTQSSGYASHSEGLRTVADGHVSHAEGQQTYTTGWASHAEGNQTTAEGGGAHAEGGQTVASGVNSHAEGTKTVAVGDSAHAEGTNTRANGDYSHAAGIGTVANGRGQFVVGTYNAPLGDKALFVVGYGVAGSTRNALVVNNDGGTQVFHTPVNENDVVRLGDLNTKLDKTGGTVSGNLTITGDLTVNGTEHINNTENLNVKNAMIYSNADGATLAQNGGIGIKKNATDTYGVVYDPISDSVKLGLGKSDSNGKFIFNENEGQPVAIRDDSAKLINDNLVKWDSINHKLVDSGKTVSDFVVKLSASLKNQAYVRDDNGVDTGLPYTYTDEGGTLALRSAGGQVQVSTPVQDKDAANKSYADNLNARYVSTSILGG